MGQVDGGRSFPGQGQAQGVYDLAGGNPVQGGLFLVQHKIHPHPFRRGRIVDIHHPGLCGHDFFELGRRLYEPRIGHPLTSLDLGHQGGQDRRPRRGLHQFQVHLMALSQGHEVIAQPEHDGVALHGPALLGGQVDPDVGHVAALTQVVVPHQSVEVLGRGQAHIGGEIAHLGHPGEKFLKVLHHPAAVLQRSALGQIQHDLKFVLVVKGQHLKRHLAQKGQGYGSA